jgi:hypothetical protein
MDGPLNAAAAQEIAQLRRLLAQQPPVTGPQSATPASEYRQALIDVLRSINATGDPEKMLAQFSAAIVKHKDLIDAIPEAEFRRADNRKAREGKDG